MDESNSVEKKSCERWQHTMKSSKERYKFLFNNAMMSDIQFVVNTDGNDEKKRFYAHKFILTIHSSVFEAMFYGSLANDSKEIEIVDITPKAFENMLSFIYTEEFSDISDLQSVFMTIYAAEKYHLDLLMKTCCEFLSKKITPVSALEILVQAKYYNLEDLANKCLDEIESNTKLSIESKEFFNIDFASLCTILQSDHLTIDEYELYLYVLEWSEAECYRQNLSISIKSLRTVLGDAIKLIRFPLIGLKRFTEYSLFPEYCLLTDKETVQVYRKIILGSFYGREPFDNNPRRKFMYVNVVEKSMFVPCKLRDCVIDFIPDFNLKLCGFTVHSDVKLEGKRIAFSSISLEKYGSPWNDSSKIEIENFCLINNEFFHETHYGFAQDLNLRDNKSEQYVRFGQEHMLIAYVKYALNIKLKEEFTLNVSNLRKECNFHNFDGSHAKLTILNKDEKKFVFGLIFSAK